MSGGETPGGPPKSQNGEAAETVRQTEANAGTVAVAATEVRGADDILSRLPTSLLDFLSSHGVDTEVYSAAETLPRYLRLNPRCDREESLASLAQDLGTAPTKVPWLDDFYSLPNLLGIARTSAYKAARVYGIDAASGVAVEALDPQPGDHVLELCAAPGGKLSMIGDRLQGRGSVTGVDLSQDRAASCRTILRKYSVPCCRLFVGDATTFDCPPPRAGTPVPGSGRSKGSKRKRNRQPRGEAVEAGNTPIWDNCPKEYTGESSSESSAFKAAAGVPGQTSTSEVSSYDRVLVDAECTHDGSLKHIIKHSSRGWEGFENTFLQRLDSLHDLQRSLLSRGLQLVKEGGIIVYSTCSMTRSQNEEVVQWLLDSNNGAVEVVTSEKAHLWPYTPGDIEGSIRMNPAASNTSALFICKLRKLKP